MENYLNSDEIPMGLGMALAQNPKAMQIFAKKDKVQQKRIIEKTHSISSKTQMKAFVQQIENNQTF